MTIVETRISVWEALAGRAPGEPVGPADPGLWQAVAERRQPGPGAARAARRHRGVRIWSAPAASRYVCSARRTTVPGTPATCGWRRRSGSSRSSWTAPGRWPGWSPSSPASPAASPRTRSPASSPTSPATGCSRSCRSTRTAGCTARRRPWPVRLGRGLLAAARGRRVAAVPVDPLVGVLYKAGGRLLFTRAAAVLRRRPRAGRPWAFGWTWSRGDSRSS